MGRSACETKYQFEVALLSNYNTRPINTELYFTASSLDVRLQPLQNVVE